MNFQLAITKVRNCQFQQFLEQGITRIRNSSHFQFLIVLHYALMSSPGETLVWITFENTCTNIGMHHTYHTCARTHTHMASICTLTWHTCILHLTLYTNNTHNKMHNKYCTHIPHIHSHHIMYATHTNQTGSCQTTHNQTVHIGPLINRHFYIKLLIAKLVYIEPLITKWVHIRPLKTKLSHPLYLRHQK